LYCLGVRSYLDKIVVSVDRVDCEVTFVNSEFVIRDYKSEGFEQGAKTNDDPFGPELHIATVQIIVKDQEVPDFNTRFGDK
jgi:hypothetical protein